MTNTQAPFERADGRPTHNFNFQEDIFIVGKKQKGIYFKASEKERNLIEQKMALAGVHNMSAFIHKMSIDGYVVNAETLRVFVSQSKLNR